MVIPYYDAPRALTLTLAALEYQRYPRQLFEVIVVDDGSPLPPALPQTPFDLRLMRQERRGFGLARARNRGARAAMHDILVFLDGDMIADPDLLIAHARWHHVVADAVTMGSRTHLPVAGLDADVLRRHAGAWRKTFAASASMAPWEESHLKKLSAMAGSRENRLYQIIVGANVGVRRAFFESVGGFHESFTRWGGEDNEFAFRAFVHGGLLVPAPGAFGWHQGMWTQDAEYKKRSAARQRFRLAHLIAAADNRRVRAGLAFAVPQHVVTLCVGDAPLGQIVAAAEAVLGDPITDLVLRIDTGDRGNDDTEQLRERFDPDPRVTVGPHRAVHDEFHASPFYVALSVTPGTRPGLLLALRIAVRGCAMVVASLPDGNRCSIMHAWAANRARRTGRPIAELGDVHAIRLHWGGMSRLQALLLGDPLRAVNEPGSRRVRIVAKLVRARRAGRGWCLGAERWRSGGSSPRRAGRARRC